MHFNCLNLVYKSINPQNSIVLNNINSRRYYIPLKRTVHFFSNIIFLYLLDCQTGDELFSLTDISWRKNVI